MNFVTFFNLLVISMTLAFTSANAEVTTYKSRRVNARYRLAVTWTAPASSTPYVPILAEYHFYAKTADRMMHHLGFTRIDKGRNPSNIRRNGKGYQVLTEIYVPNQRISGYSNYDLLIFSVPQPGAFIPETFYLDEQDPSQFLVADNGNRIASLPEETGGVYFQADSATREVFMYTAHGASIQHAPKKGRVGYWHFTSVPSGKYQVAVTWPYSTTASTRAKYSVIVPRKKTILAQSVNQREVPRDFARNGSAWTYLMDENGAPIILDSLEANDVYVVLNGEDVNTLADAVALKRVVSNGPMADLNSFEDDFESYVLSQNQYDGLWSICTDRECLNSVVLQDRLNDGVVAAPKNELLHLISKRLFKKEGVVQVDLGFDSRASYSLVNVAFTNDASQVSVHCWPEDCYLYAWTHEKKLSSMKIPKEAFNTNGSKSLILQMRGDGISASIGGKTLMTQRSGSASSQTNIQLSLSGSARVHGIRVSPLD